MIHKCGTVWLCRNAIILVLSNGFSIGCILSVFLHLVLPFDAVDAVDAGSASSLPTTVHPSSPEDIAQQKVSSLSCCQNRHNMYSWACLELHELACF